MSSFKLCNPELFISTGLVRLNLALRIRFLSAIPLRENLDTVLCCAQLPRLGDDLSFLQVETQWAIPFQVILIIP